MTATSNNSNDALPGESRRRLTLILISLVFILTGIAYAVYYHLVLAHLTETDNAYVGGNLISLSSQVNGNVAEINADETQLVKAGSTLVKLESEDAELALNRAEAHLGEVVRQQREKFAGVAQYDAAVRQRELAVRDAREDLSRRQPLAASLTVSSEELAHAGQALENAQAALSVARKQAEAAHSAVAGTDIAHHPAVQSARTELIQAWLASQRNNLLAPVSGYVAKRSVQVGNHITAGAPLMVIVPLDQLWIDANFKESELANIRIGQPATISADVYGSKQTYHGKVLGLAAGTGSAFSLLPAQNATGNWIKVVQRLPVRIALDSKELATHPLRVGLSTTVSVDTADTSGAMLSSQPAGQTLYSTASLHQPTAVADKLADDIIRRNLAG